MSISNSIANVRKPIGSGLDRAAFYSEKYDLVIKKSRRHGCDGMNDDQTLHEREFFMSLTEDEKKFFPAIDYMTDGAGRWVCLMKRCIPIMEYGDLETRREMKDLYWDDGSIYTMETADAVCEILGIDDSLNEELVTFIGKRKLYDMHFYNFGVLDNHLVVLDAGM